MNGEYRDNIDNWADWEDYDESLDDAIRPVCMTGRADGDEMTEADWDRHSADFERRYNEHLRSIKSSSPRGSLMPDPAEVMTSMIRPHEDTMAAFFLESQW